MPELPEVETVRLTLRPAIGARVTGFWSSGQPLRLARPIEAARLKRATVGAVIEDVRRWGKYLLIDLVDRPGVVLIHLGMSGRLRLHAAREPRAPHTHVVWRLAGGRQLRFADPRRFGVVALAERGREREHPALAVLGPDPLTGEVSGADLFAMSRTSGQPLKTFLLDQSRIAGIGNIYASEALWAAGIHPGLRAHKLTRTRADALARAVRQVLEHALTRGGTSLRDFVDADGRAGENAEFLRVYDRAGESCPRPGCRGAVRRVVTQGRATFFCPTCQQR
jgi:formamidopyrimidine-DNA glycosylase